MTGAPGFIQKLEKEGFRASVVSAEHLQELEREISGLHEGGLLCEDLYHQYESQYFHPKLPANFGNAKSIIIMATPQPMIRTTFRWKGKDLQFIVPPTYFDGNRVTREARAALAKALGTRRRYRLVRGLLPQKLLAARSRLAMYGRNNITYVPGLGSMYRLTSFYTDYDSPVDFWQEKRALPTCEKCKACMNACPTKAIQSDRFLLHVDHCLTYLNEKKSSEPFPDWVRPQAHNALIGCMRCQMACPYDSEVRKNFKDRGRFSEDEVKYLLKGDFRGQEAKAMEKKLGRIGLDLSIFPRNLKAILDQI